MRRFVSGLVGLAISIAAMTAAQAQGTVKIGVDPALLGPVRRRRHPDRQRHQALHEAARRRRSPARRSRSSARMSAARRPTSPSAWRRSWWCATAWTSSPASSLTPNALGGRRRVRPGQEVHGGHERRHLDHHHQVALLVRTSVTLPQVNETFGHVGLRERHPRRPTRWSPTTGPATTPRARSSARSRRPAARSSARCASPVANPDFSAFVQRAKDLNPESIFIFVPGGAQPAALGKALAERGIDPQKIKVLGHGRGDRRAGAESMGDAALGIITAWHYDHNHDSALNKEFVEGVPRRPTAAQSRTSSRSAATTACTSSTRR